MTARRVAAGVLIVTAVLVGPAVVGELAGWLSSADLHLANPVCEIDGTRMAGERVLARFLFCNRTRGGVTVRAVRSSYGCVAVYPTGARETREPVMIDADGSREWTAEVDTSLRVGTATYDVWFECARGRRTKTIRGSVIVSVVPGFIAVPRQIVIDLEAGARSIQRQVLVHAEPPELDASISNVEVTDAAVVKCAVTSVKSTGTSDVNSRGAEPRYLIDVTIDCQDDSQRERHHKIRLIPDRDANALEIPIIIRASESSIVAIPKALLIPRADGRPIVRSITIIGLPSGLASMSVECSGLLSWEAISAPDARAQVVKLVIAGDRDVDEALIIRLGGQEVFRIPLKTIAVLEHDVDAFAAAPE